MGSLDERTVLTRIGELLVPSFADAATVDLIAEDGTIERVHFDGMDASPGRIRSFESQRPEDLEDPARSVLATGAPQLTKDGAGIAVPLSTDGGLIGVLTLRSAHSVARSFDAEELGPTSDLGRWIATALDNARTLRSAEETQARYRALVQSLDAIVWEAHADPFRFTFVSDYAVTLLGYSLRRWNEPGFWEGLIHPDDRARAMADAEEVRHRGKARDFDYRVIASDGRTVWLRERLQFERDPAGSVETLRGLMIDVTAAKSTEVYERAQAAADRVFAGAGALADVPRELLRSLCETLHWDLGSLWHVDDGGTVMRCTEVWHADAIEVPKFEALSRGYAFAKGVGLPGRVWESGEPAWIEDVTHDENFPRAPIARSEGLRAAIGFPVTGEGRILGVIEFFSKDVRRADPEMLALMQTIGAQIGQFFLRRMTEEHAIFQRAVLESQNEATIDGIVVTGRDGRLVSYNKRFAEMWHLPPDPTPEELEERVFSLHAHPAKGRETSIYLFLHPEEHHREEIELTDGRIFDRYSAPLRGPEGTIVGRAYHYRDITDRKRTERMLAENSERFEFLARASELLSATLDYTKTLENLARLAVPYLGDWCVIDMVEANGRIRRVAIHHSDPEIRALAAELQQTHQQSESADRGVPKVIRSGRSDLVNDIADASLRIAADGDQQYFETLRNMGFTSYMCVPLVARGETIGAITFVSAESQRHYGAADLSLAEDLARRAGLAVENARLYSERAWVARTLQESLLPPLLPEIPGLEVAAIYHPAARGLDVGGDFYDLFDTGRGEWAVLVGDVCGKGADAAALTALARYTIRAAAMQARAPRRVLGMLNQALIRQNHDERFCTVAYLRVYPDKGEGRRVTLACGGHPLPLVLRANGSIERAGRPSMVLGVFPDARPTETTVTLAPGDAIVVFTDGVTEARGPDGEFGEQGIKEVLAAHAGESAQKLATALGSDAVSIQTSVRDDIAVVVLRVPPIPA